MELKRYLNEHADEPSFFFVGFIQQLETSLLLPVASFFQLAWKSSYYARKQLHACKWWNHPPTPGIENNCRHVQ